MATKGQEEIITKNGESCVALIDAKRLDHHHRLEREHIHLTLLEETVRGRDDLKAGKTLTLARLKSSMAGNRNPSPRPEQGHGTRPLPSPHSCLVSRGSV
ncbi:hypothetical protein [Nitrospira sp. Kam-Ns4a]